MGTGDPGPEPLTRAWASRTRNRRSVVHLRGVSRRFGTVNALARPRLVGARGTHHRAARPERRRQDDGHPHDHRGALTHDGDGPRVRPRPLRPTARRCGAAAASCRPSRRCTTASRAATTSPTPRSCTASAAARRSANKIHAAATSVRHRARPRPAGRRLLDRHEDPPRAGPLGAARAGAPALRRADLGPRPRVEPSPSSR